MGRAGPLLIFLVIVCWALFSFCEAGCEITPDQDGHVNIPESWTKIPSGSFDGCKTLKTVTIHNKVTHAQGYCRYSGHCSGDTRGAFTASGLVEVTFPDSFVEVGWGAFRYCTSLKSVTFGTGIRYTGGFGFQGSSALTTVTMPISNNSVTINLRSFTETQIKTLAIGSKYVSVSDSRSAWQPSLQLLTFSKNVRKITGLSGKWANYLCVGGGVTCTCAPGYGNAANYADNDYFNCLPCKAGSSNVPVSQNECKVCGNGTYTNGGTAAPTCFQCATGKYSLGVGVTTGESVCKPCNKGYYNSATGSAECQECPPGSFCPREEMGRYALCEQGKFTNASRQTSCTDCPAGRYQDDVGQAVCFACPAGKHNNKTGSIDQRACSLCEEGKYSNQPGSGECQLCGKDSVTASKGEAQCTLCPVNTTTVGATSDGTGASKCVPIVRECRPGEERSVQLERCVPCLPGNFSEEGRACLQCPPGSYSDESKSLKCKACTPGKYGARGGLPSEADACHDCARGKYASRSGALACEACPAGTACDGTGMSQYELCTEGSYTDESNRYHCDKCPAGTWQNDTGSAKCVSCGLGTYNSVSGSTNASACTDCTPGTMGDKSGLAACTPCPLGQYQEGSGQAGCKSCLELGEYMISNAQSTGCVLNEALLSKSLVEVVFDKGVALYGSVAVAAAFVTMAAIMQFHRERHEGLLGGTSRVQVIVKSFLPGFCFGSEVFMSIGLSKDAPAIVLTLIAFRCLHVCAGVMMFISIYGSEGAAGAMEKVIEGARTLRDDVDKSFSRGNMPIIGMLTIFTVCDATMIQFMPWRKSRFFDESKGFPSMGILKFCLITKTVQSCGSVIGQLIYVFSNRDLDGPTTSAEAKALFGLNICASVLGLVMGLLMLILKGGLLRDIEKDALDSTTNDNKGANVRDICGDSEGTIREGDYIPYTTNPMLMVGGPGAGADASNRAQMSPTASVDMSNRANDARASMEIGGRNVLNLQAVLDNRRADLQARSKELRRLRLVLEKERDEAINLDNL